MQQCLTYKLTTCCFYVATHTCCLTVPSLKDVWQQQSSKYHGNCLFHDGNYGEKWKCSMCVITLYIPVYTFNFTILWLTPLACFNPLIYLLPASITPKSLIRLFTELCYWQTVLWMELNSALHVELLYSWNVHVEFNKNTETDLDTSSFSGRKSWNKWI